MEYGPLYDRLFALIFIVAYLAYLFITVRQTAKGLIILMWKRAEATITRSELEIQLTGDEIYHIPRIVYSFEADGRQYNGERIALVGRYGKIGKANTAYELLAQYPVGKTVTAHYPPDQPEQAVLKSGLGLSWLLRYALFVLIPVFTLGLFVTADGPGGAIIAALQTVNERFLPVTAPLANSYGLTDDDAYLILGILFLMVVFYLPLVFWTLRTITRLMVRLSWREVEGAVTRSGLQDFYRNSGNTSIHYFRPVVQYRYRVDEKDYTSVRLAWSGRDKDEKRRGLFAKRRAEGVLEPYPVGTAVSVRYDPAHPYISTLKIRVPFISLALQLLVIVAVLLFLLHPQEVLAAILSIIQSPPTHLRPI